MADKYLDYGGLEKLVSLLKGYTDDKIASLDFSLFVIVSELPTSGISENKIYLVPGERTESGNVYTEYVYTNSAWEKMGEVHSEVDLSGYVNDVAASGTSPITLSATISGNKLTITASVATATASALGVVKVTDGNGLTLSSGVISMAVGSASAAGALQVTEGNGLAVSSGKISMSAATTSASGAMSSSDKTKLDALEEMEPITDDEITSLF